MDRRLRRVAVGALVVFAVQSVGATLTPPDAALSAVVFAASLTAGGVVWYLLVRRDRAGAP